MTSAILDQPKPYKNTEISVNMLRFPLQIKVKSFP